MSEVTASTAVVETGQPPFTFTAEFTRSSISTKPTLSSPKVHHGFLWRVFVCIEEDNFLAAYLLCSPLQSATDWSCTVSSQSISLLSTGSSSGDGNEKKTDICDRVFDNPDNGWGWRKFVSLETLDRYVTDDKFTLSAELTVKECNPGTPTFNTADLMEVCIHKTFDLGDLSPNDWINFVHDTQPRLWKISFKRSTDEKKMIYKVEGLHPTEVLSSVKNPVTITIRCGDIVRGNSGPLGEENSNVSITSMAGTATVSIRICETKIKSDLEAPVPSTTELPARFNFGRETLSVPQHGNFSLILADGTNLKLNSYILSYNSPELQRLIVDANLTEHDVTDFHSDAVGIFVDACYTGTLEKLTEATEFHVFQDLAKMVAVFKVDWAVMGCLEFFRNDFQSRSQSFAGFMKCCRLALSLSTKHKSHEYLNHIVAAIDPSKLKRFSARIFAKATSKPELDLLMALFVESDLIPEYLSHLLALGNAERLYVLENFNFDLCERETLELLCEDLNESLEEDGENEAIYNFTTMIRKGLSETTEKEVTGSQPGNSEEFDERLLEDGTLATLGRILWAENETSTWPCSKKRPFCSQPRQLTERKSEGA